MASPPRSFAIGIDLGTTYCCAAVLRHPSKKIEVIQNDVGKNTTPSYVAFIFDEAEDIITGNTAKDQACDNPEYTIFDMKRLIGRSYYHPNIQRFKQLWPFHVVNMTGLVGVEIKSQPMLPQVICKNLISYLKTTAEKNLGCSVDSAVVTIPVHYNSVQRDLTRGACEESGFKSVKFIPEPVAAALAYGLQSSLKSHETKTCLIFDLGGGTFDITVFQLCSNNQVDIIACGGDESLGGQDFDDLLTEYCINEFMKSEGVHLSEGKTSDNPEVRCRTARNLRRLRNECEKTKCYLSADRCRWYDVTLECIHGKKDLVVKVTREKFENLIDPLLGKAIDILRETLNESGVEKVDIDEVILIGGSCRIPKVQNMVKEYFEGKQILKSVNVDEAVAHGAAIHAYNVFKDKGAPCSITMLEGRVFK